MFLPWCQSVAQLHIWMLSFQHMCFQSIRGLHTAVCWMSVRLGIGPIISGYRCSSPSRAAALFGHDASFSMFFLRTPFKTSSMGVIHTAFFSSASRNSFAGVYFFKFIFCVFVFSQSAWWIYPSHSLATLFDFLLPLIQMFGDWLIWCVSDLLFGALHLWLVSFVFCKLFLYVQQFMEGRATKYIKRHFTQLKLLFDVAHCLDAALVSSLGEGPSAPWSTEKLSSC